ncbi:MAG TPA: phage virion morphogenesis protein [Candidatus Rifleibacterium sp.]|nr:phage virion morphogenesis protein [Candidatus Rifleibacterium sp.]HPT45043.1 phage virion morphogenesis protein [Candidatus Rifleibacterium sp.]
MIELEFHDQQVRALLNAIIKKTGDATEAFDAIGDEMILSVERNFAAGGRFSSPDNIVGGDETWKPLSPVTEKIKARKNKKGPHQILIESGTMAASVGKSKRVSKNTVSIAAGTEYAATQHFGAKQGSFGDALIRAHVRNLTRKGKQIGKRGKPGKEKALKLQTSVRAHFRKAPFGNIPPRPFMTLHPESIKTIIGMLGDYLTEI